jgi:hypothetical protein
MIYEILDGETVVNTIVADAEFMAANYPAGNYREVPEPEPVPVLTWIVTRNAFQNRFPMTANGVSTKYDLMTLFLTDTGYAESLGVTGSDLYSLRSIIITGNNRLGVVTQVDLQAQETIDYVNMTTNAAFPDAFRLTTAEASTLLTTPAAANEIP